MSNDNNMPGGRNSAIWDDPALDQAMSRAAEPQLPEGLEDRILAGALAARPFSSAQESPVEHEAPLEEVYPADEEAVADPPRSTGLWSIAAGFALGIVATGGAVMMLGQDDGRDLPSAPVEIADAAPASAVRSASASGRTTSEIAPQAEMANSAAAQTAPVVVEIEPAMEIPGPNLIIPDAANDADDGEEQAQGSVLLAEQDGDVPEDGNTLLAGSDSGTDTQLAGPFDEGSGDSATHPVYGPPATIGLGIAGGLPQQQGAAESTGRTGNNNGGGRRRGPGGAPH